MIFGSGGGRIAESVKARVRRASLLRNEDFKRLLDQGSVSDVAVQLSQGCYASLLKKFNLQEMRRSELEFLLDVAILGEGVAFRHYMGPGYKELLDLWLENFDIELLKNHLRIKLGTEKWEDRDVNKLIELVSDFRLTLVDQEKLFAANSLREILNSVRKDSLRAALMEAVPAGLENIDIAQDTLELRKTAFSIGMILDRHYFDTLYTAMASLRGNEGRMMRDLVGTRVDLMNLYWIYRARRFFNMSPEAALTLIMKVRYHVDFERLTKVAFADPGSLSKVLEGTPYDWVFDVDVKDPGLREVELESNIYKVLWRVAQRVFLSGSLGFQNVAAYLMLKEFEVRDLVAVVEAVRYCFDKSKIDLILIRSLGEED